MQVRYALSPVETATLNTDQIRENFLIESLFQADQIKLTYTHFDRVITGGIMPVNQSLTLGTFDELKSNFFLERREIGFINVGGKGTIVADGVTFEVNKLDCVYLGKGTQNVALTSAEANNPAQYFVMSCPAHATHPNQILTKENASPVTLGSAETSNHRTIYKYIHLNGLASCQLVMGLTVLEKGSVWNTMPTHVHDRRMEVYCYFDVADEQAVCHFMGQPQQTRHIWVKNHQAIISPPWSIHSGCGTGNYSFIWAMAGENLEFTDMDAVKIADLK